MRARAILLAMLFLATPCAVFPPSAEAGSRSLNRRLRRTGKRLDRALIRIDRALLRLARASGQRRVRKGLRKAQRKLRRFLEDADIRAAYDELTEAMVVLADPTFSPHFDTSPLRVHTDAAVSSVVSSPVYSDSHADGFFLLGATDDFSRHEETHVFRPLGRTGPFDLLRIKARDADLFIENLRIFFGAGGPVESQVHAHIDWLDRGRSRTFVLGGEFIDYVRIRAESDDDDDERGRLQFWGVDLDP